MSVLPSSSPGRDGADGDTFHLFVYGTLRSGARAASVLRGCELVARAHVHGTLYDIDGEYPALLLYGSTPVEGEVWRCPSPLLLRLDAYEGVPGGLFRRVAQRIGDYACWLYVAGPALSRKLTPVQRMADGRWPGRIT